MKKNPILLTLFFFSILLSSCGSSSEIEDLSSIPASETSSSRGTQSFENPFACIGQLHNMAIDSILAERVPMENLGTYIDAFTLRHSSMVFDMKAELRANSVANRNDLKLISHKITNKIQTTTGEDPCDSLINEAPKAVRPYLVRMKNVIATQRTLSMVASDFNAIDVDINNDPKLDIHKKSLLLAISAIGAATLESNLARQVTGEASFDLEATAAADLAGAVVGALKFFFNPTSLTGLTFGPGGYVLTGASVIVGEAIYSSARSVVLQLFLTI